MISLLKGKIVSLYEGETIIMTSAGVGYSVFINPATREKLKEGEEVEILTYLAVRENAMELFGFLTPGEKDLFLKFLDVSGIGPRSALHLLSLGSVEEITGAIGKGDVEYLTKVSGVGKKTAERIVVELKNKVNKQIGHGLESDNLEWSLGDVVDGLLTLGYSPSEARDVAKKLEPGSKTSQQLLKEALRMLSR